MKNDFESKGAPRKEENSSTPVHLSKGEPEQNKNLGVAQAHTAGLQQMPRTMLLRSVMAHKRSHYWSLLSIACV